MSFFLQTLGFMLYAVVGTSVFLGGIYVLEQARQQRRLPKGTKRLPGPKSFPIIGRVHDVPPEKTWLKFYEWSKEYGPIYQHEMFGSVHIWISSEAIAHELLSKRANIYSDRPQIPNLPNNRTSGEYLALSGRNDTWRRQRRLCAQLMSASANAGLHEYPSMERNRFLYLMWKDPSQYREWVEQFTARTVSRLSWGSAHPSSVLRETTFGLLETISPSGALPNVVSWLMHLPEFLSPWKQKEAARHDREAVLLKGNVRYVHDRLDEGNAEPSFVRTYLANLIPNEKEAGKMDGKDSKWGSEAEATYVVGQMAIAGALTIGSPIQSFLLAMIHFPLWQKKLQAEIDAVYGCDGGPPQWADREKLPTLRAVVKEVIRWRPPVPTGIPHALEQDDIWEGYFIPGGATIHALEWSMTRNEETYPDPESFNPGRWLDPAYPTYREPLTQYPNLAGFSQFGFGRRTCQGVPIVDQDLYLAMGGVAWAFDVIKKKRADGTEVPVHWNDYTPLLIAKPAPFEFDLQLRGPDTVERERKIKAMWEAGKDEEDAASEEKEAMVEMMAKNKEGSKGDHLPSSQESVGQPPGAFVVEHGDDADVTIRKSPRHVEHEDGADVRIRESPKLDEASISLKYKLNSVGDEVASDNGSETSKSSSYKGYPASYSTTSSMDDACSGKLSGVRMDTGVVGV